LNALGRLGRRRRDSREQAQTLPPFPPFVVDASECIRDGAFALLRVNGSGAERPAALVVDGQSFDPLPSPDPIAADGSWRAAFALPTELTEPGNRLWLHDAGDYRAELSIASTPAPAAPQKPEEEETEQDPRARKLVEAWSEAAQLREKLSDREEELADALKDLLIARNAVKPLEDAVDSAAQQLATVREEVELLHDNAKESRQRLSEKAAELDSARAELATGADARSATERAQADAAGLREQVAALEQELAGARAALQQELAGARAELDSARAEHAATLERVSEAQAASERAQSEAAGLREQVAALQQELTDTKAALEHELSGAKAELDRVTAEAEAERARHSSEAAKQAKAAGKLQAELQKLQDPSKQRRLGIGRRVDDHAVAKVRAELEARITAQQQRIEELEREATSFAERRGEAVDESLRQHVEKLEAKLRTQESCADDLRALLASEREQVARVRGETHDLKGRLARATSRADEPEPAPAAETDGQADQAPPAPAAASEPLPWTAVDDELLARIEKAKALTS
jgi:chromosome segregation ATPase